LNEVKQEVPVDGGDDFQIAPAQQAILRARLQAFEADLEAGYTLEQVKARLKDGSWRTGKVQSCDENPNPP
jgi:hypothetical protein